MFGLRQKISLGLGGLLLILAIVGMQSIRQLTELGQSINAILLENYKSIAACQEIKEAIELTNSGLLYTFLGNEEQGNELIRQNIQRTTQALDIELHNITIPGEQEKAFQTRDLLQRYQETLQIATNQSLPLPQRQDIYNKQLLPLSSAIKNTADSILRMNQENMIKANTDARKQAVAARRQMYIMLLIGAFIAGGFVLLIRQWVILPIYRLIDYSDEIRRGNLELVVQSNSHDEIGQLSEAFNAMAASLRELTRNDRAKLARIKQLTQQAFKSLPDAVAMINIDGVVEVATETAQTAFGLKPEAQIQALPFIWISDLLSGILKHEHAAEAISHQVIQHFVQGQERYFRPRAVPIVNADNEISGVILVIEDVTQLQQHDELKRGLISTVSHQLKTPLTSVRLALHLLLEEKVGPLTPKQLELLVAARDDSERLHAIIEDLLDISRIQSGKVKMECRAVAPQELGSEAIEKFRAAAQDRGLTLNLNIGSDLPEVWADPTRISHVFANLLSNAVKYTAPGGKVNISATADDNNVYFSVSDTGKGIPARYLTHVFEQFFRIPDQSAEVGAGLGLAIAKEIVEAHEGVIKVESQEGVGSTFNFSLKRADAAAREEQYL